MTTRELKDHVNPGDVINLFKLKEHMPLDATIALTKTDSIEIIRMVLPAGKKIAEHHVKGEISVQCLKGAVDFSINGQMKSLTEGDLVYLSGGEPHALSAVTDAVLLVTIILNS